MINNIFWIVWWIGSIIVFFNFVIYFSNHKEKINVLVPFAVFLIIIAWPIIGVILILFFLIIVLFYLFAVLYTRSFTEAYEIIKENFSWFQ